VNASAMKESRHASLIQRREVGSAAIICPNCIGLPIRPIGATASDPGSKHGDGTARRLSGQERHGRGGNLGGYLGQ
jgi:hypothetical protein